MMYNNCLPLNIAPCPAFSIFDTSLYHAVDQPSLFSLSCVIVNNSKEVQRTTNRFIMEQNDSRYPNRKGIIKMNAVSFPSLTSIHSTASKEEHYFKRCSIRPSDHKSRLLTGAHWVT